MALGPMSTPRRSAPRSIGTPSRLMCIDFLVSLLRQRRSGRRCPAVSRDDGVARGHRQVYSRLIAMSTRRGARRLPRTARVSARKPTACAAYLAIANESDFVTDWPFHAPVTVAVAVPTHEVRTSQLQV